MQKSYYQQLSLQPLTAENVNEMLRDLLGTDPSLAGLAAMIRERTGGTPLFIEEIVQTLAEDGSIAGTKGNYRLTRPVETLMLPATVQAVLAARIDRLTEREKEVLQTAAVIGKQVPEAILRQVSSVTGDSLATALRTLVSADFLYEAALYPETEYTFKHPLTEEVAYHSQLGDRRTRLHGSVARTIQALYADKLDERAALIAAHLEKAGEVLDAARWHARAAQWAGAQDRDAALRHWQRVRKLLTPMTDSQEAVALVLTSHAQILNFFWNLGVSEEEAASVFSEGQTLATRAGDHRALALLNSGYASIRLAHGAADHLEYAREAQRLADASGDVPLQVVVRGTALTRSLLFAGHWSEGLICAEEAMDRLARDQTIGTDVLGYNPYTWLASIRAIFLVWTGRVAESVQWFQRAIQRAREDHDLMLLGVVNGDYGGMYSEVGDPQVALPHARQGVELTEKAAGPQWRAFASVELGRVYLRLGLYAEAVTSLERSRTIIRESHTAFEIEPWAASPLAEAYAYTDEPDRALATAKEAVSAARQRAPGLEPFTHLSLARVLLRTKGLTARGAIEGALEETSRLARQMGLKTFDAFVCIERSELARLSDDETTRQRELREAHRLFAEIGASIRAEEVAKELAG
jgi:adenylate cyclase